MAVIEINWRPSNRELRVFAIVQLIVISVAAWLLHRRLGWDAAAAGVMMVSASGLVAGMMQPQILRPMFVAWMMAAFPLGWVMSHLLLGLVYYGVMTPIGLVLRLCGHDPLRLRKRTTVDSFWVARPKASSSSRYLRQF